MGFASQNHSNCNSNKSSLVFAKRKPAFKIRIDSLRDRSLPVVPNKTRSNKSVRFAEHRNTVLFRHVLDSELQQSWYSPRDYCDFSKDSNSTIAAFQLSGQQLAHLDPQRHCIRGLEAHASKDILVLRQTRIRTNIAVVLDQQRSQKAHGLKDSNMLSAVSMMFSKVSRQHALSMGALDSTSARSLVTHGRGY